MAEKGPHAPTPKPVRAKFLVQSKTKDPPQKAQTKQNPTKTNIPWEPRVVIHPIEQQGDQAPLNPPNQPNQLPTQQDQIPIPPPNPPDQPNQLPEQQDQIPNPPPNPPNLPSYLPNQPQQPPENPFDIMQSQNPPQLHHFNWSYFKLEFLGKTEEDAVANPLKTNDQMETHNFPEDTKVRRFCLTLTGEARLLGCPTGTKVQSSHC